MQGLRNQEAQGAPQGAQGGVGGALNSAKERVLEAFEPGREQVGEVIQEGPSGLSQEEAKKQREGGGLVDKALHAAGAK